MKAVRDLRFFFGCGRFENMSRCDLSARERAREIERLVRVLQ